MNDKDKEIVFDADDDRDDSVVAEEAQTETIKKLRAKLKNAEAKAKENLDALKRAQADFVNMRKRDEESRADFLKFANVSLISNLLPVLDSFSLALAHGNKEIEPVHAQLISVLKASGLEELNPLGRPFDPNFHEAVGMIKTDKPEEDHKVLEVLQKGYIISGKTLRPAKVRIGEFNN